MVGSERRSSLLAEKQADTFQLARIGKSMHPLRRGAVDMLVRHFLSAGATLQSREYTCGWDCDIPWSAAGCGGAMGHGAASTTCVVEQILTRVITGA